MPRMICVVAWNTFDLGLFSCIPNLPYVYTVYTHIERESG